MPINTILSIGSGVYSGLNSAAYKRNLERAQRRAAEGGIHPDGVAAYQMRTARGEDPLKAWDRVLRDYRIPGGLLLSQLPPVGHQQQPQYPQPYQPQAGSQYPQLYQPQPSSVAPLVVGVVVGGVLIYALTR
jgi:hypothetical protein